MGSQDRKIFDLGTNIFIENLDPDVDEKIVYDTFSTIGVIAYNPKIPVLGSKLSPGSLKLLPLPSDLPKLHPQPVVIFANMLETTLVSLQDIALENIFDESGRMALCSDFAKLMQQEPVCLQWGDMSLMNKLFLGKCLLHPKRQQ
ncbi:hypothetical protein HID58_038223 [Brassica napus]|uniref:RRM domain-containing protein n=1 Tax=Brassica napus TaxID=3708 RepID=A0ABQ8BQE1_BRANA|nr:hypothetical protein HID58_038223 [Brassica napus]